jgi:hypothetical protein
MKNQRTQRGTAAFALRNVLLVIAVIFIVTLFAILPHQPAASPVSDSAPAVAKSIAPAQGVTAAGMTVTASKSNVIAVASAAPPPVRGPRAANTAFDDFSAWVKLFTNQSASMIEGERLVWKRREAMLELIQTDPKRAIELSVPFAWRQTLPRQITKFFEQQLDGRGDYFVAAATDFSSGKTATYRTVTLGGTNYQAFVYGRRTREICRTSIPLHGIALDGKMAVSSDPLRKISFAEASALANTQDRAVDKICSVTGERIQGYGSSAVNGSVYAEAGGAVLCFCSAGHYNLVSQKWAADEANGRRDNESAGSAFGSLGGSGTAGAGTPVSESWTHGSKSVLYMRLNFPDDLTEPISESDAYAVMDSVNSFYTAGSYDQTALDATVAPLVTLPQSKAYYAADPGLLLADARTATKSAGYDTANYDLDITCFDFIPGPNYSAWSGLAAVGGKALWLQTWQGGGSAGVTAHELGHNYGLWHANFWNAMAIGSSIGPGTNLEYGNIYDTMGLAGAGNYQFNAVAKHQLDWLNADAVQLISTNGVYRIYPFDSAVQQRAAGRFYAAAVQKDFERYYWLEFRKLFAANPWAENGVMLEWSSWDFSNGGEQLLDATPLSPTFSGDSRDDAAVVVGRTFNDNLAGVHITPVARGSTGTEPWMDVQVNLGPFPGNHPPALSVEVDSNNVPAGALVHFHATAADPDGDTLAYAWFFDDSILSVNSPFSTNNLPWISKAFSQTGGHVVRCVASDMKGGEASANAVITVGAGGGFRIMGRVTDANGLPLEGVFVSNGSNDMADFIGGWTDSDGRYVIVNITNEVALNAIQFGYNFSAATNWSNPVTPTNDTGGIDFVGLPLPAVNIVVDTNIVPETDSSAHYFTITRTGDTNSDFTVPLVVAGTATLGTDFSLSPDIVSNTITIPAGSNSVTLVFHTIRNSIIKPPQTATLTLLDDLLNPINPTYALAPPAAATITIFDDDAPPAPTVTVAAATPRISEDGADNGEFIFSRAGSLHGDLLVNYAVGGTALPGANYTPLAGLVLIPSGQTSATVYVQPLDDHLVKSNQTVTVTITPNSTYSVGSPASDTLTIQESDATVVTVVPTAAPASESSSSGMFTIKRDGDLTYALMVGYTVGGTAVPGANYIPLSGAVTIPAGAASAAVTVIPLDDGLLLPDTYVTLILTNAYNYDVGTPGSASIYIAEAEKPTVSISLASTNLISEQGDIIGEFLISRTTSAGDLTVNLAVSGSATPGADYLPVDNPALIPDGLSSVMLDVIAFHDLIYEPTENVVLTVLPGTNYNVSASDTARINILDDGTSQIPGVGFCFAASAFLENRSPGIAVALSVTSSVPVAVDYKVIGGTAPGSRYSLPSGTLVITNDLVGFIPLKIVNDTAVELPQTVKLVLFNPINATLDAIKTHTYTILDDDSASVSVTATVASASEAGPVAGNFRISRAGATNANQLVSFQITGTASAPSDYVPLGNSVAIPAGASFVDLPVIPTDDRTAELPQTVVLTLISATNGTIVSPNKATVIISDNDTNPLPVVAVSSTNQPYAVEGGASGAFVFTRIGDTNGALAVSFSVSGMAVSGVRYVALTNLVTIPAGQFSATLPVVAIDDAAVEGEQTVVVSISEAETYRSAYPSSATVTVQDNDQRVWIDASDFAASKYPLDPGEFTFSRFGTTNTPVTVFYTISGTATNGLDYVLIINSIVIPANQLSVTLPILPRHTGLPIGPATVTLALLADTNYFFSMPTNATVRIDDDMPMVTLAGVVTNVLEGSSSNGVFRLTRTGDPQFNFTAYLSVGGTAVANVDYAALPAGVYFGCGVTAIDLYVSTFNKALADGDHTVTAALVPNPAYTILSPSNGVVAITDAGADQTPVVLITRPREPIIYLTHTNRGLMLVASVMTGGTNLLTWTEENGRDGYRFDTMNLTNAAVFFTNAGVYRVRLTADDGVLQGFDERTVVVGAATLTPDRLLDWPFSEGEGTNVHDYSGLGHDGTPTGGAAWTTNGLLGYGMMFFGGSNDAVQQVSGRNVLNGRNAFTLSLWLKAATNVLAFDQGIFTAGGAGGETLSLAARTHSSCGDFTNVFEATVATTKGMAHRVSANNAVVTSNQWQHLVLTWTNGQAPQLYINGKLDQPALQWATARGGLVNCPDFIVGRGPAEVSNSWSGAIDEVELFPVALSEKEIISVDGGGVPGGGAGGEDGGDIASRGSGSCAVANNTGVNAAPEVDAGTNTTVQINTPFVLTGTAADDCLPDPPAALTVYWTQPFTNAVTIPDTNSLTNTLTFTDPGDYTFRLTADDSDIGVFAEVTVTAILPTEVDISADLPDAYELGPQPGEFTLTRTGATNDLTVYLSISGTASNALDYVALTNVVIFAGGSNSLVLPVMPFLDYAIEHDESVIVTIITNVAYYIGNGSAQVTIHDSPYGEWSFTNFSIEQINHPEWSGPGSSFSHDGIANFAKYAFNLNPFTTNTPPPYVWDFETSTNDNRLHLTLTYTRRLPPRDVEYGVYVSTNLPDWKTGTNYVEEFLNTNNPDGFTETVKTRARMPYPGTNNLFMNIRVWLQQVPGP